MSKSDNNWKVTRVMTTDLSKILDKDIADIELILRTVENLLIHKFLEVYLEDEDHRLKDYEIELPYLGTMLIHFKYENSPEFSFTPRLMFARELKAAYNSGESPLTKQLLKELGDKLEEKYIEEGGGI